MSSFIVNQIDFKDIELARLKTHLLQWLTDLYQGI